jgi:hypothetical protein
VNAGWGRTTEARTASTFLFNTAGSCEGSVIHSNIGMTADVGPWRRRRVITRRSRTRIPNVDADTRACVAAGAEYDACWAALDQKLMEEIVLGALSPGRREHRLGDTVENTLPDQSAGPIAYSKIGGTTVRLRRSGGRSRRRRNLGPSGNPC